MTYRYDIHTTKWSKFEPNIDVPKVDSHSAVVVGDQMLIYGGYIPEKAQYLADMYAFDLEKHTWQLYHRKGEEDQPEARSDFDMILHDGSIWLFGGSNGKTLNDFWKFDHNNKKWTRVDATNGPEVQML